jgi:hypothetical protein
MTKNDLLVMYNADPEFCSIYHGNVDWTPAQCAEDSWDNIKDLELHLYDFGYIAVNRFDLIDRLGGFFIKPDYRNKESITKFLNEIDTLLPGTFLTCVHSSNKKAVKFLSSFCEIVKADNITTYLVRRTREN